jgi:hypothetical protein
MTKTLRAWAIDNGVKYNTAYRQFLNGKIENSYREGKHIYVKEGEDVNFNEPSGGMTTALGSLDEATPTSSQVGSDFHPVFQSQASTRRSNKVSRKGVSRPYEHIEEGLTPFAGGGRGSSGNCPVDIMEAVELTQLAYYNYNNFRSIIDLLTELSISDIYLEGGSVSARKFLTQYLKAIKINDFQEKWFLEYYRSGNVFSYALQGVLKQASLKKIQESFSKEIVERTTKRVVVPLKYIILNPRDIITHGSCAFHESDFYKKLNPYELEVLRNPRTEQDKAIKKGLNPEDRRLIDEDTTCEIEVALDPEKTLASFYKKQDYEPFAVPMGFGVLRDINFKAELRSVDQAIARTTNQVVLLITLGFEDKNGKVHFSAKNRDAIQEIFNNESVGRVLIADFTTKAQFLIPDIASILDPKKYVQVDKDIKEGLNNILQDSGDKFANKSISIKLFTQKLLKARQKFLTEFVDLVLGKVGKAFGFRKIPKAKYADLEFKEEDTIMKIWQRFYELGLFTAEETLEVIHTGKIPSNEESVKSQKKFAEFKKDGLYEPITGGPSTQKEMAEIAGEQKVQLQKMKPKPVSQPRGRPKGAKAPKTTQKVGPVGGPALSSVSLTLLKDNIIKSDELRGKLESIARERYKVPKKKELNDNQKHIIEAMASNIMSNEPPQKWNHLKVIKKYLDNPIDFNEDKEFNRVLDEICAFYQTSRYVGTLLMHSTKEA